MKNVLVTGGAGFIGGHIVDELIKREKKVIVVDNESSDGEYHYNNKAHYLKYDILCEQMDFIFQNAEIDTVFHLAARSRIPPSLKNPVDTCEVNFMGTLKILELSRKYNIDRVVYSSTSSAYGLKNETPSNEDMPVDCLNPYSTSKVAGELLCKMYNNLFGLNTITFRYFNVYGERQPTEGQYAPVIGIFYRQKSKGEPMTIVGAGEQTRDFVHVSDVVEANMLAGETLNKEIFGEILNVGTGESHSVMDIAKMIEGDYVFLPMRESESLESRANINKIKKLLGFKPRIKLEDWLAEQDNK
ncbi:MAG: hypothetical protein CMI54_05760 [Parcubacteria group bacterium]|nr:hypothetical protein [Parcubacteria group bacterium]|tara:strand:- start:1174 stop:2076 length:903 start_codon:yes stop_codon:yes gene_type:complete